MVRNLKYVWVLILSICSLSLNAQESKPTYYSLIENTLNFSANSAFYDNEVSYNPSFFSFPQRGKLFEIVDLLNLDVVRFYKLWDTYDTELKKKVYVESEEGQKKYVQMKQEYDRVKQSVCTFLFWIGSSTYDLASKSMKVEYSIYESHFGNIANYVEFNQLCLSLPASIKKEKPKRRFRGSSYFYNNTLYIPVNSETKALEIENHIKNCALLFIFKLDKAIERKASFLIEDFVLGNCSEVYIVNTQTGEIYQKIK